MFFDKYIKEKLNNYASPVSEKVWERIVAENQKQKPVAFWLNTKYHILTGFFIILGITSFFVIVYFQSNHANTLKATNHKIQQQNKPNTFADKVIANANLDNQINNYTPLNETVNTTKEISTNVLATNLQTTQQQAINKNKLVIKNNTITTHQNTNISIEQKEEAINQHTQNIYEDVSNTTNINNSIAKLNTVNIFSKKLHDFNPKPLIVSKKKYHLPNFNIDCPGESNSYQKNWYVEGFLAPEYVFKNVTALDPNSLYMQKKNNAEKMIMGVTLGAKVTKGLSKNLYVKSGVQFSQLIEKMSFQYEKERKEITVITIRTETDINGNVVTVSDTTKQLQISYGNNVRYNVYRNLELPISLGYEFYNRGFKASFNGGVIVNLASWYQGKVFDTNLQLINAKEATGTYKHNVGLSLYGSVSLIKPLNEQLDIFAEPYFRYNISQPKYNSYGYKQKFSAAGVSLGLRFKLNHKSRLSLNN
jgi:hypothetical protein